MGLLFRWIGTSRRADNHLSNLDCAALRAMTSTKGEGAVMLFVILPQLLQLCGANHNFVIDRPTTHRCAKLPMVF